jgi:predicted metal-binding membrane protein
MGRQGSVRPVVVASLAAVSGLAWLQLPAVGMPMMASPICGADLMSALRTHPEMAPWLLMVLAMAPPLLFRPLMALALRPDGAERVAAFTAAYAAVWMAAGLAMPLVLCLLQSAAQPLHAPVLAVSLALAVAWQATPWKQRALNLCHAEVPLAGMVLSDLGLGARVGLGCVGACWPWMWAPMAVAGDHRISMLAIAALLLLERLAPTRDAAWRLPIPRVPAVRGLPLLPFKGKVSS